MWSGSSVNKTVLGNVWGINNRSWRIRPLAAGEAYCQPRERQQRFGQW